MVSLAGSRLVVPALSSGENDIESRLGGGESHRGGSTGNGAANNIGSAICNADNINEEILAGEVGGIGTNEEAGGTTNDGRQTHIGLAVLVRWLLDVLEGTGEDCSGGTKAEVKSGTATDPSSGKYLVFV